MVAEISDRPLPGFNTTPETGVSAGTAPDSTRFGAGIANLAMDDGSAAGADSYIYLHPVALCRDDGSLAMKFRYKSARPHTSNNGNG